MATELKVLYASAEIFPFAGTGGLGDVGRYLPQALRKLGVDICLAMPLYRTVRERFRLEEFGELPVRLGRRCIRTRVFLGDHQGIRVFFIDQPQYFDRPHIYGPPGEGYPDNALRFAAFCRALVALCETLSWPFRILHCHDWHTALLPLYLPKKRPPVLLTIHNLGYQGDFPLDVLGELGVREEVVLHKGRVNFLKAGILSSDLITTVSPTYAREIQTPEYGFGLDPYLRERSDRLLGILNGVDYSVWDPRKDPFIPYRYGPEDLYRKALCKRELLRHLGLPSDLMPKPLFGMISRLVSQKGIDLLLPLIPLLSQGGYPVVILGVGEEGYQEALKELSSKYELFKPIFAFDEALAHRITAASDLYLMPSLYEPCGLNQMYSLRYGTIPVVRDTGGLSDTVRQVDLHTGEGTGFKFRLKRPCYLLRAIRRGIKVYENRELWRKLQRQAMAEDFSWDRSARQYLGVYRKLLQTTPR